MIISVALGKTLVHGLRLLHYQVKVYLGREQHGQWICRASAEFTRSLSPPASCTYVLLIVHLASRHTHTLSLYLSHTQTRTNLDPLPTFEDHNDNDNDNCHHQHCDAINLTFFVFKSEKTPPNQPPKDCSNRLLHPQPSLVIYPPRTHAFHFHFKFHLEYQSKRGKRRIRSRDGAITPLCCSVGVAWLARLGHPHRFASHHRPTGLVENAC